MRRQIKLLKGDEERFERMGELDVDGQQKDPRGVNSWKLLLADVSTVEIAEVMVRVRTCGWQRLLTSVCLCGHSW